MTSTRNSKARWIRAAVVSAAALTLITGCTEEPAVDYATEGDALKTRVAEALERTEAANAHRFDGSLAFRMDGADESAGASLLPLIGEGFAWSGALSREPLRLEADVRFPLHGEAGGDASGQSAQVSMPLLIQDNKLYANVPMLNQPEEYLVIDLESDGASGPIPVTELSAAADALDELATTIVAAVDPEWVRLVSPEPEQSEEEAQDGASSVEKRGPFDISIQVTEENAERIEAAFREGWTAWTAALPAALSASSPKVEDDTLDFDLAPGSSLLVALDEEGFVADQRIDFTFTQGGSDDAEPIDVGSLSYRSARTDIGGTPEMKKTVPASTLPFEHLLRFLAAGREQS
ncbi:hypothetical protein MO973_05740 [Paenibacillus sp. TRM 82003]|nr:hypothetical protein [Paenibacillus sp. TRM 82003]